MRTPTLCTIHFHSISTQLHLFIPSAQIFGRPLCQSLPSRAVDEAVERAYLQAVAPAQLQLALRAGKEAERHEEKKEASRRQQLDKARDEAALAERRYKQVDPDNRLVSLQLEREWND